jgi:hypothetical protein
LGFVGRNLTVEVIAQTRHGYASDKPGNHDGVQKVNHAVGPELSAKAEWESKSPPYTMTNGGARLFQRAYRQTETYKGGTEVGQRLQPLGR